MLKLLDLSPLTSLQILSVDIYSQHVPANTRAAFPGWLAANIQRFPSNHPLQYLVFDIYYPETCSHFYDLVVWSPLDETVSTRGELKMVFKLAHYFGAELVATFRKAIKTALPRSDQLGLVSFG